MGLIVSDGKTRAQRRAEAKALKAKAKFEAKYDAKARRKAEKVDRKDSRRSDRKSSRTTRKQLRAESKAVAQTTKSEQKLAAEQLKVEAAKIKAVAESKKLTPTNVKRYLAVARLVAPIAAPVIYRASVGAREQLSAVRANRAGISPDVLRQFSGRGATRSARIATTRASVENLAVQDQSADGAAFVAAMNARLANLATAVDAAEMMPTAQRRSAHQAIDRELSAIDGDILARLGVQA